LAKFREFLAIAIPDYKSLLPKIHSIYEKRKRADHREIIYGRKEAEEVVKVAKEIIQRIKQMF